MTIRQVQLRDIADLVRNAVAPAAIEPECPYVGLEHLDSDGHISPEKVQSGELKSQKFAFAPEHILFGKLRPYLRKIARPDFEGVCSTDIIPILAGPDIDRDYLYHQLRSPRLVAFANSRTSGANLPRLNPRTLLDLPIGLPPLAEQRRIAEVLDRVEGVRRRRREAARQLEGLALSVFERIVGDPVRNPLGWPVKTGEELFASLDYGTSAKCYTERAPGALPVIRIPNVTAEGHIDWTGLKYAVLEPREREKLRLRASDILFVRTNGNPDYIGRCTVVSEGRDSLFASYLIRGRISEASGYDADFLRAVASHPSFRSLLMAESKTTAGNYNISAAGLRRLRFVAPPPEVQMEFLSTMAAIAKVRGGMAKSQMEALALATSISGAAFGAG